MGLKWRIGLRVLTADAEYCFSLRPHETPRLLAVHRPVPGDPSGDAYIEPLERMRVIEGDGVSDTDQPSSAPRVLVCIR